MLEKIRSILLFLSVFVIAGGLMLYIYVLSKGDGEIFGGGSGTLPATKFTALTYQSGDKGYLLCDQTLCSNAEADGNSEPFNVSSSRLRQIVADYSDEMPTVETRNFDFKNNQFEFLERMPGETYPTVIVVRIQAGGSYSSKLVIYSFKPVGSSTHEDHQDRIERWLEQLRKRADGQ